MHNYKQLLLLIFLNEVNISSTSFSKFDKKLQFFGICLLTRPQMEKLHFSDPSFFKILHIEQDCRHFLTKNVRVRAKKSIFWIFLKIFNKVNFSITKVLRDDFITCNSWPRTFFDFSVKSLSRPIYEQEAKNLHFLKITPHILAKNSLGYRDSAKRTWMPISPLNSGASDV